MTNLTFAAAVDIAAALSAGTVSSGEITHHYIDRIESLDSSVNALCVSCSNKRCEQLTTRIDFRLRVKIWARCMVCR